MAHIDLGLDEAEYPGITGLMRYRPETAVALNALAEALLHAPHPTLTAGERELIAAYVSGLNDCTVLLLRRTRRSPPPSSTGHAPGRAGARADVDSAPVSAKLRACCGSRPARCSESGRKVTAELVDRGPGRGRHRSWRSTTRC